MRIICWKLRRDAGLTATLHLSQERLALPRFTDCRNVIETITPRQKVYERH